MGYAWLAGVLATILLGSSGGCQEPQPRGRAAGWVVGDDGKRVVDAEVTLLSRPLPGRIDIGETDLLRVRTGADGIFRTELLHGRAYSAWAVWQDADGGPRRTRVLEGVVPGPPRAFEPAPAQTLRAIRIVGAQAWQTRAPLTATAFTASDNYHAVPLQLAADGVVPMPTLPGDYCSVEVRTADGMLIGFAGSLKLAGEGEQSIELPAPREVTFVVVDAQGAPIAGARIRHAFGYHHRDLSTVLGQTDAAGTLRATVPSSNALYAGESHRSCMFLLDAPGRQRMVSWTDLGKVETELRLTLPEGPQLTGRILAEHGTAARGLTLLPDCYAMGADAATTGLGVPISPVLLDERGGFTFGSLHPHYDFRLLALLDPSVAREQGLRLRDDVAVAPVIWLAVGKPPFAAVHDLGEIHLDRIPVAQIEVRTHDGVPVPAAHLYVITNDLYNSPVDYVCDRVGRLQFPLPAGEIIIGAWVAGGGVATRVVSGDEVGGAAIDPLVLTLSETRTVRGVVVDGAGKPVAGIRVLQWNRATTDDRPLAELTFLARATSEPTGPDGSFALTLPVADLPFTVRAIGKVGDVALRSGEVTVAPHDHANGLSITVAPVVQ